MTPTPLRLKDDPASPARANSSRRVGYVTQPIRGSLALLREVDLTNPPLRPREIAPGHVHVAAASPRLPARFRRPVASGERRLREVLGYLTSDLGAVGPDAICELDTRPGHSGITVYNAADLGHARHHVFVKGAPPPLPLGDLRELRIVTGLCLWSSTGLGFRLNNGDMLPLGDLHTSVNPPPIDQIEHPAQHLTVSEVDGALRQAAVIAGIVHSLPAQVPVTIVLDVPRVQYHLHALGRMSPELAQQWMRMVDARHRRVELMFATHLADLLQGAPVVIETRPELDGISPPNQTLDEMLKVLGEGDWLWRELCSLARPDNGIDLAALSYVAALLRAGASADGRRLALAVEDPREEKILRRAYSLLAPLQERCPDLRINLLGLYPLSRIWACGPIRETRPSLYFFDPGRWAIDARTGDLRDLLEAVHELYPESAGLAVRQVTDPGLSARAHSQLQARQRSLVGSDAC
ncbi:UNVERIFIED_ORG: hypothetical protein FHR35_009211 [Microbispora rosea subsp. rosea]